MNIILGEKIGMTQIWSDKGKLIGATVVRAEPNIVIRQGDRSFVATKTKGKANKAQSLFTKAVESTRGVWVKEVKDIETDTLGVDQFKVGDVVTVTATTKGKGFAGTIKRHNFHRGPMSHGGDNHRGPGSIGAQRPQRVPKGQKMGGHMGAVTLTGRGNKVLSVEAAENILVISGNIPGPRRGKVIVRLQERA